MKKSILFTFALALGLGLSSCDSILDRPQKNTPTDDTFWQTENDLRLYANDFYLNYFIGYGKGWSASYSPFRGYTFSDDVCSNGAQAAFEDVVPASRYSVSEDAVATYMSQFSGPSWNFAWVRKANIMISRINERMNGILDKEAFNHWMAVAKFFKSYSYSRLTEVFGDVPYYERAYETTELDALYKDRDSRILVMDSVYEMGKYVLANMRTNDGANFLNRYVAAAFYSRWFLFEGTWQKYHNGDAAHAKKYLEFARDAAELVMKSGKYEIKTSVRDLWGSQDLASNKEVLMYRHFDAALSVTHCVASYSNSVESQSGVNLAFLQSIICQDGKPYATSTLADAQKFDLADMAKTRDPRFEAQFIDKVNKSASTLVYQDKFIDRAAVAMSDKERATHPEYQSVTNTNDAPVIRYGEVLLNWIEAKAELATMGGAAVTQADIDASINVLRDRPLDATAKAKGLKNTVHMMLADINAGFDPNRDQTVDPLIWEVRRERRLEMVFEHSRILDLRRWKKLDYMDNAKYPATLRGPWVNFATEMPEFLKKGSTQVETADGTIVTFDGTNADMMVGYYVPTSVKPRPAFTDRVYLAPIGDQQISDYQQKGYHLTQTIGW